MSAAQAELRKLAHTLDVGAERLAMVAELPADDLRALRRMVGEAMFQADRPALVRVAALSRAVPPAVAAKLAQLVLPPLLAARTSELLEPHRAAQLVIRMPPSYLADVSRHLDAARAPEVVAAIPPDRVADVAAELARREEWVVIGSFVAQVTGAALAASVARLTGEQLLRVGFVLEDVSRLDEIGGLLSDAQVDELLVAAGSLELWAELAELLGNLSPARLARLAERYGLLAPSIRSSFESSSPPMIKQKLDP
ncbi:MAG TPA: hypothetical protein VE442_07470 [Jatrophihabitans sp.]|jgi:hypothetical protein|nr:hypothetical protein [Jatrophihabitans sp.]